MMRRRPRRIFAVLAVVTMLLVACGADDDPGVSDGDGADDETTEEDAGGIASVHYLNQETDPPVVQAQRDIIETFNEQHPNIDVILEGAPGTVIAQRIATNVQAGGELDVIAGDAGSMMQLAAEGLLEPLDDVVDDLGGRDEFRRGALLIIDDTVYGLNSVPIPNLLHYNQRIFDEVGVDVPDTWDETLEAARTIHESGIAAGIGIPAGQNRGTDQLLTEFVYQACGSLFDRDGNPSLNTEAAAEALTFYAELLQYAPEDAVTWEFVEQGESFVAERTAMHMQWFGLDSAWRTNPDLLPDLGVTFMPQGETRATGLGSRFHSVFSGSPNIEESKQWLEHLFTPEEFLKLTAVATQQFAPPTHTGVELTRDSDIEQLEHYGEQYFESLGALEHAIGYHQQGWFDPDECELQDNGPTEPLTAWLHSENVLSGALQDHFFNDRPVEEALEEAQQRLEEIVERERAALD